MIGSGCGSPTKDFLKDGQIKFILEKAGADGKRMPAEIVASTNETLEVSLLRRCPRMNVKQRLFWAKVRGHDDVVCLNPKTFVCGSLRPDTVIQWKSREEKIYYERPTTDDKTLATSAFYVQCSNREKKEGITNIHYGIFKQKDLRVDAMHGESIIQALRNDGRFKNLNRFSIHHGPAKASPSLHELASSFDNVVFSVKLKRSNVEAKSLGTRLADSTVPRSSVKTETLVVVNQTAANSTAASGSCIATTACATTPCDAEKVQFPDAQDRLTPPSAPGGISEQRRKVYVFPKAVEKLSNDEMFSAMEECARLDARTNLVAPEKQDHYEKEISKLVVDQFALQHSVGRSAWLTKRLAPLIDSVGRIRCGTVSATCFLISSDMVITNYHVIQMILNARRRSIVGYEQHHNIFVDFDYEVPGLEDVSRMVKVKQPLHNPHNIYSEELDYAILCLEREMENKLPLGPKVTCQVPDRGVGVIIGHPCNREKSDENCVFLPKDKQVDEPNQRVKNEVDRYRDDPESRGSNAPRGSDIKCIHMHKIFKENNNRKVVYDVVSMFEGSSGSPVFNEYGEIVALHTQGYRLLSGKKNSSLFELGVTFHAIIEDIKLYKGKPTMVTSIFPNAEKSIECMDLD